MPDTILKRWNGSAFEELYPKTTTSQIVASGTASSSTFLRGDGQWAVPAGVDSYINITGDTSTGMQSFYTALTNNYDYQNSPISIRERGGAGAGTGDDNLSPNLNFHWSGRVTNSLWMGADARLNWGGYSVAGIPAAGGIFRTGSFQSTVATGTAPLTVTSTTRVSNLNVATAGTADTLTTGRTINVGTGASGTATSFNGSANITIPINSVSESYLSWGGQNTNGYITPIGMSLSNEHSANRLAFINGASLDFEYSADAGSTWTNYNYDASTKSAFCTTAVGVPIGRTTGNYTINSRTRITLTAQDGVNTYLYTNPRKMLIEVSSSGSMQVLVETRTGTNFQSAGAWTTFGTYSISGWSGWNDIPLVLGTLGGGTTQTANNWQLRLTFIMTSVNATYPTIAQVSKLRIFGENTWFMPSTLAGTNDLYSYDMSQNALFPAIVQGTRFTSTVATGTAPLTVASTTAVTNLNADLLDGNHSTAFAASVHTHDVLSERGTITYGLSGLQWNDTSGVGGTGLNGAAPNNPTNEWWHHLIMNHPNASGYYVDIAAAFHTDDLYLRRNVGGTLSTWRKIWTEGNDGTGSGLDADLLDGNHASAFLLTTARNAANGVAPLDATSKVPVANLPDFITGAGRGFYLVGTISGAVSLSAASTGLVAQLVALSGGDYENMYGYMWTAAAEVTLTWTDQTTLGPTFQYHVLTPGDEGDSTSPVTLEAGDMIVFTKYSDTAGDNNDQEFTFSVINSSDPRFANYLPLTGGTLSGSLNVNSNTTLGSSTFGVGHTVTINSSVGGIGSLSIKNSAATITGRGTGISFFSSSATAMGSLNAVTTDGTDLSKAFIKLSSTQSLVLNTNSADRMTILADGNVGIGTSTPATKLHLFSGVGNLVGTSGSLLLSTDDSGTDVTNTRGVGVTFSQRWNNSAGAPVRVGGIFGVKTEGTGNYGGGLSFYSQTAADVDMSERMRITSNGNVGIGTTAPAVKLHVAGGTRIVGQLNVMGDAETKRVWVDFEDGNDMGTIQVVQDGISYKNLALQPDGSNVGIGTRTPGEKLEVSGNAKATRLISTQATGTAPLTVASTTAVTNLNADLLDGNHASAFVLKSGDTMTGSLTVDTSADFDQTVVTSLTSAPIIVPQVNVGSTNTFLPFLHQTALYNAGYITHMNLGLFKQANGWGDGETGFYVGLGGNDSNPTQFYKMTYGGTIKWINNSGTTYNFWSSANHGASSGLDADLLDGYHASSFVLGSSMINYALLASPTFTGTPTAPTATAGTNTTQIATTAFVSTAVANLINSAPGALDTLDELAAALGDDASFATTVTNSIASKANDADVVKLTGTQSVGGVKTFTSIPIFDAGATIANNTGTISDSITFNTAQSFTGPYLRGQVQDLYRGYYTNQYKIWDEGNDGSTSGLDADLLDGNHASAFALTSHSHGNIQSGGTMTGSSISPGSGVNILVSGTDNVIGKATTAFGTGTTTFLRNDGTWANPDVFSYASLATSTSRQNTTYTTFLTSATMDANSRYEVEVSVIFYKTSTAVARHIEYNIIVDNTTGTPTLQLVGEHSNIGTGSGGMNFYVASTTAATGTTHTTLPSQTGAYTRIFNIKGIVYTGTSTKTISIQDRASATLTGGENVGSGAGSYIKVRKIM